MWHERRGGSPYYHPSRVVLSYNFQAEILYRHSSNRCVPCTTPSGIFHHILELRYVYRWFYGLQKFEKYISPHPGRSLDFLNFIHQELCYSKLAKLSSKVFGFLYHSQGFFFIFHTLELRYTCAWCFYGLKKFEQHIFSSSSTIFTLPYSYSSRVVVSGACKAFVQILFYHSLDRCAAAYTTLGFFVYPTLELRYIRCLIFLRFEYNFFLFLEVLHMNEFFTYTLPFNFFINRLLRHFH